MTLTTKTRDDRKRFRTVEVWHEATQTWTRNATRVTPKTAAAILANLTAFGHTARIVPNVHYAGVFAPSLEPR